ncbi:MAG TPA: hypothetical protein VN958_01715 [Chitinophagaceae bacterium]|nr:hypothetical protein [Chitinophagaceae bacterium]
MVTSFHLNTADLNNDFIEKLKKLFGDKKNILITVEEDKNSSLLAKQQGKNQLIDYSKYNFSKEDIKFNRDEILISS